VGKAQITKRDTLEVSQLAILISVSLICWSVALANFCVGVSILLKEVAEVDLVLLSKVLQMGQ
jgi:hypothetical protein